MEETGRWPKTVNHEMFPSRAHGAPGFTARFNLAVSAFMAHPVSLDRYGVCVRVINFNNLLLINVNM